RQASLCLPRLGGWLPLRFARASLAATPPLGAHVLHVVGHCPEKQMGRVHARGVVAAVKHASAVVALAGRYRAIVEFPGQSVCLVELAPALATFAQNAVAGGIGGCHPHPTSPQLRHVWRYRPALVDLGPEALFQRNARATS